jgi:hypothetical protein
LDDNEAIETKRRIAILGGGAGALAAAFELTRQAGWNEKLEHRAWQHQFMATRLERFNSVLLEVTSGAPADDDEIRRLRIVTDLSVAIVVGMLADGILFYGFDVIENEEFREWAGRHGARPESLDSALIRGGYDYIGLAFTREGRACARSSSGATPGSAASSRRSCCVHLDP